MTEDTDKWVTFPMIECPHCGKEFQADDWYDVKHGSTMDCSKCEKTIHFSYVDTVTTAVASRAPKE